jgi:hypothetical protein
LRLSSCIRGAAIWGKVMPMALGKPGLQIAVVTVEGALVVGVLLLATWLGRTVAGVLLIFACGDVLVAMGRTAVWLLLLKVHTERGAEEC